MRLRRVGIVLAIVLAMLAAVPAFIIGPDPETGDYLPAVIAALVAGGILLAYLLLAIPAWSGGRRSGTAIAVLTLIGIIPSLPAYFLPAELVGPFGISSAVVGTLLAVTAFTLIMLSVSTLMLYVAATIVVVATYAALVAFATSFTPAELSRTVQTIAAIAVALLFTPVLRLLQRTIGRTLYGHRRDRAAAARRIARGFDRDADGIQAALEQMAQTLRLPRISLERAEETLASAGADDAREPSVRLPVDAEQGLALRVWLRPGESRLHADDRASLELVALPLGLLVRETQLLDDLRIARASVVEAREVERVTLHRDLHDDLGPLLTGAVLRADAASNLLTADSPATAALTQTRHDLRSAIAQVRRIAYGLWPLDLEQWGLWHALELRAERSGASVDLPAQAPELPAATTLAVYRIVGEALTNADRHAPDSTAEVRIETHPDQLSIRVRNAADTEAAPRSTGLGVRSIRARAEELGGRADVGLVREGWVVDVRLPLGLA